MYYMYTYIYMYVRRYVCTCIHIYTTLLIPANLEMIAEKYDFKSKSIAKHKWENSD